MQWVRTAPGDRPLAAAAAAPATMVTLSFSRGFKVAVLLVCVVAFIVLSSISLTKYIRADVVRSFEVDESAPQTFAVIFCKSQETIFKPDVYETITGQPYREALDPMVVLGEQFPFGEVDVESALWNMTYGFSDMFLICASFYNKPCDARDVSSGLYHYGGQCHTVRYDNSLAEGRQRGLMLELKPQRCDNCFDQQWIMYVFSAQEQYLDWEHVWAPSRVYLQQNMMQTFKVTRTLEKRLPTKERPCSQEKGYTQTNCIRQCLSSEMAGLGVGCRLPWHESALPVCNNRSEFQQMLRFSSMVSRAYIVWYYDYQELHDNHYYKTLGRFQKTCKRRCVPECHRDQVAVTLVDRARSNFTFITLSINDGLYVSTQSPAYDFQQLMSDIGGNLGLLLGASIFTLFEMIEGAARHLWERRKQRHVLNIKVNSADAASFSKGRKELDLKGISNKQFQLTDVS